MFHKSARGPCSTIVVIISSLKIGEWSVTIGNPNQSVLSCTLVNRLTTITVSQLNRYKWSLLLSHYRLVKYRHKLTSPLISPSFSVAFPWLSLMHSEKTSELVYNLAAALQTFRSCRRVPGSRTVAVARVVCTVWQSAVR